ncbi:MAG TPA: PspA/IM30 family protein [Coleofasciculaceae cyanobacterium]
MGLFDRVSRLIRANVNDLVNKAEDPEKILEQSIADMQEDLVQMRQAVAQAIASQQKLQKQYNQAQGEATQWQQRAQLALQKGDENLAREALSRKKVQSEAASTLKAQLDQQVGMVDQLKRNLIALEGKISEAKTKKDMLKARAQAAKANEQLQGALSSMNTSGAMAAFERMEEKVMEMEARSTAALELSGVSLEQQFASLESGSDVDDELAAMKAQMLGGSTTAGALPAGDATPAAEVKADIKDAAVDAELEALRRQLNDTK